MNLNNSKNIATYPEILKNQDDFSILINEAPWIKVALDENTWIVTCSSPSGDEALRIDLNIALLDGSWLSDPKNAHLLLLTKEFAYHIRQNSASLIHSTSAYIDRVHRLHAIIKWMNINKIYSFGEIEPHHIEQFTREICWGPTELLGIYSRLETLITKLGKNLPTISSESCRKNSLAVNELCKMIPVSTNALSGDKRIKHLIAKTTVEHDLYLPTRHKKFYSLNPEVPEKTKVNRVTISNYLTIFSDLFALRNKLSNDKLAFDPFPYGKISKISKDLGSEGKKTPTPHLETTMELIDKSLRWVLHYGPEAFSFIEGAYKKALRSEVVEANKVSWALENHELVRLILIKHIDQKNISINKVSLEAEIGSVTMRNFIGKKSKSNGKSLLKIIEYLHKQKNNELEKLTVFSADKYSLNDIQGTRCIGKTTLGRKMRGLCDTYIPKNTGVSQPWPLEWSPYAESGSSNLTVFSVMTNVIPMACFIVIAAFTARRKSEIWTITENCITHINDFPFIDTYICKTRQRNEDTPCPEVVIKAVELLEIWSAEARKITNNKKLFQIKEVYTDTVWRSEKVAKDIKKYCAFIQLTPLGNGQIWEFNAHQFRRFFAMMYMWRYQLGELDVLKHHLRHDSIEMTKIYVTELVDAEVLAEVEDSVTQKIIVDTCLGKHSAMGGFGERLKQVEQRMRKFVRKNVSISSPGNTTITDNVSSLVGEAILKTRKRAKPNPWGWCFCGSHPADIRTAKCVGEKERVSVSEPIPENAVITACATCPHSLVNESFLGCWVSERNAFKEASEDANNPELLRDLSQDRFEILDKFLKGKLEEGLENGQ